MREFLTSRRARVTPDQAGLPAFVLNQRLDVLAANELGRSLYERMFTGHLDRVNHARFIFLDPASHDFG